MKQVASLKICVLGGRSFGKTSLLSPLIAISGTKEAVIIALGDNQRKLAIYNGYKDGHGKLSATSWDDICQFRYKITGSENREIGIILSGGSSQLCGLDELLERETGLPVGHADDPLSAIINGVGLLVESIDRIA